MEVVRTVAGDVDPSSLGPTLAHEHLVLDLGCYWEPAADPALAMADVDFENLRAVRADPWGNRDNCRLDAMSDAVSEVAALRDVGGTALIDVTGQGIGRDLNGLAFIARTTGVQIVGATGYYIERSHPGSLRARDVQDIEEEFIVDIVEGDPQTGIRAGVIGEVGAGSYPASPSERRVLLAAAHAQKATGAAVVVHPAPHSSSIDEVIAILGEGGADLTKIVISHVDERCRGDLQHLIRIAEHGCNLGFDTFGREAYFPQRGKQHPSDADRLRWLAALVQEGLGGQVLLSQDICLKIELSRFLGPGLAHVMARIVPRAGEVGLTSAEFDQFLVANPQRVFSLPVVKKAG